MSSISESNNTLNQTIMFNCYFMYLVKQNFYDTFKLKNNYTINEETTQILKFYFKKCMTIFKNATYCCVCLQNNHVL